jgi:hypothetical protein
VRNKQKEIIFTNISDLDLTPPHPAINDLPDWYVNQPPYLNNQKFPFLGQNTTNATVKKCVPVFDAVSLGYILCTPVDIWVTRENGIIFYNWKAYTAVQTQSIDQAPTHPASKNYGQDIPKIMNSWSIKTPKGYSCLFLSPMHRDNVFTILPGVVDTDSYNAPINFPFVLSDSSFEGLVPAGTPVVQIIPFKRENWVSKTTAETDGIFKQMATLDTAFYNGYKRSFWKRKKFK